MMQNDRMDGFLNSFLGKHTDFLTELEEECIRTQVPVIRPQMQSMLRFLLTLQKPLRILEVGCAIGFSSILMAEYSLENAKITTIEKYEKRIPLAHNNIKASGYEHKITLLEGDASDILNELQEPYDMIFMDAAKAQYIHYLPDVVRLLSPGGLLVSDNILQEGDLLESRFAVTRRNRTIHARMREYLHVITHHEQLETVILPVGDGVTLSVKK